MVDIRPLTHEDCPQWSALLAAAFQRPQTEMGALLGWMHAGYRMVAYGAWNGDTLAAQYSCMIVSLRIPDVWQPVRVGMSVNMATHPDYRGQGLIKQVSRPVYDTLAAEGVSAGVGFSNAAGVKVDRHSKGYGYRVVGQLTPYIAPIPLGRKKPMLQLADEFCVEDSGLTASDEHISFANNSCSIVHRFTHHPFRRYKFGIWYEKNRLAGVVVYRPLRGGVSLMAAYTARDYPLTELLSRWMNSLQGAYFLHFAASPNASMLNALKKLTMCVPLPYSRHPYYLTAKPLQENTSHGLFDFAQWDCVGGDIL
jgi:hypothetical protein